MNKILGILGVIVITGTIIPSVIAPNPSSLMEIDNELKSLEQEEEASKQSMIEYQARLYELFDLEQEAIKDGIYDEDLKEIIEQVKNEVIDNYNKLFAIQNRTDVEVGIDALEVEDFYNIDARSNSVGRMSSNDQPGTSRTQNVVAPQNTTVSDAKMTITSGENVNKPLSFTSFNS